MSGKRLGFVRLADLAAAATKHSNSSASSTVSAFNAARGKQTSFASSQNTRSYSVSPKLHTAASTRSVWWAQVEHASNNDAHPCQLRPEQTEQQTRLQQQQFMQRSDESTQNGAHGLLPSDDPSSTKQFADNDGGHSLLARGKRANRNVGAANNTQESFGRPLISTLQAFYHKEMSLRGQYFQLWADDETHYHQAPLYSFVGSKEKSKAISLWTRQWKNEINALDMARNDYQEELIETRHRGGEVDRMPAQSIMRSWYQPLVKALEAENEAIKKREHLMDRNVYGPFFGLLLPENLAVIVIHSVMNSLLHRPREKADSPAGVGRHVAITTAIGRAIEQQVHVEKLKSAIRQGNKRIRKAAMLWADGQIAKRALEKAGVSGFSDKEVAKWRSEFTAVDFELPTDPKDWFSTTDGFEKHLKMTSKRWLEKASGSKASTSKRIRRNALASLGDDSFWTPAIRVKVGSRLLQILIATAMVPVPSHKKHHNSSTMSSKEVELVHAFSHGIEVRAVKTRLMKFGVIRCHDAVLRKLEGSGELRFTSTMQYKPMLVPPKPWRSWHNGGHLMLDTAVIRMQNHLENGKLLQAADRVAASGLGLGANKVYEALNALGAVPWKVNQKVLQVVNTAWDAGGAVGKLPDRSLADIAVEPLRFPRFYQAVSSKHQLQFKLADCSRLEKYFLKKKDDLLRQARNEAYSLRCDMIYKLNIANELEKEEAFYFPHSMDFRGRAYPIHPNLNHLGSDVCRGLLSFAEAKPLGPRGLDWLRVSVANLYGGGADKLPLDGRVQFAIDHMEDIRATVAAPLDPENTWWRKADSPWQLLAVCYDLVAAVDSEDPSQYTSALPIHQDGSCNGLQHYAALGRDAWGGTAVNLTSKDRPQDVYTEVAKRVKGRCADIILEGPGKTETTQERYNDAVKLAGIVNRKLVKQTVMTSVYGVTRIGARLQVANRLKEFGWTNKDDIFRVSSTASKLALEGLSDMFQGAHDIMSWLADCASRIAKTNQAVGWVTPLGLPVVQPYRETKKQSVRTLMQHVVLHHHSDGLPVMKARQKSAFPPNFIHSIDSTHMMQTAVACHAEGLAFAGVHDSFWTHPCDVDRMNQILREQFVALHSQPLLELLLSRFQDEYPDVDFPQVPERGHLNLEEVKDSTYFFS